MTNIDAIKMKLKERKLSRIKYYLITVFIYVVLILNIFVNFPHNLVSLIFITTPTILAMVVITIEFMSVIKDLNNRITNLGYDLRNEMISILGEESKEY